MKLKLLAVVGLLILSGVLGALPSVPSAFASTVNLTLTISKGAGGPTGAFTLSGCSVSPTTLAGDGASHAFTATNSCSVTITVPTDIQISQYRFAYVASLPNQGLITNKTATFSTCASGTCSSRTYTAYYETMVAQPTYALSSWNGGGLPQVTNTCYPCVANDTNAQRVYEATGSMGMTWAGFEGCASGNTTLTTNQNVFNAPQGGAAVVAQQFAKYQIPFSVQVPMDGYGGSCSGWATSVANQYSDLLTYTSSAAACTGSPGAYTCTHSWLRVDDMNLAKQTYNDLVATKNSIVTASTNALQYWAGLYVSSIGSDGGTGPADNYGQDTIWHFAKSQYCITNFGSGPCGTLASEVTDIQAVPSSTAFSDLSANFGGLGTTNCNSPCYGDFINSLYMLGLTYAAYNFSQKYAVGHPFVVLPAKPAYSCFTSTSLYPFPYNTTYIKGLDLCQYEVYATATVDNGNYPTASAITADIGRCKSASPHGIPGGFLVDSVATGPAQSARAVGNMMYYAARCAANVIQSLEFSFPAGWLPYPSNSYYWRYGPSFGGILNRMQNVGYHQFPKVTISGASSTTTNVTLLGGSGVPLLAWFYTNRTTSDTASVTLTLSSYHLATSCVAVSALTLAVLFPTCSGSTLALSVTIPAGGWNPVYIFNGTSTSLQSVLYSNMPSSATTYNSSALLASFKGPHTASAWMIAYDSQAPMKVANNRTGTLTQYSTLAALNATAVGQTYANGVWTNSTQQGWYYDVADKLVYVHHKMGSFDQIVINNGGTTTTTSAEGGGCGPPPFFTACPPSTTTTATTQVIGGGGGGGGGPIPMITTEGPKKPVQSEDNLVPSVVVILLGISIVWIYLGLSKNPHYKRSLN